MGTYTSESKDLVQTILRDEWGYEGTVMTDCFGGKDGARQMWAGNDMLQPGKDEQFDSIVAGVKSGKLAEADLDRNVANFNLSDSERKLRRKRSDFHPRHQLFCLCRRLFITISTLSRKLFVPLHTQIIWSYVIPYANISF
jgi:hypothetical protein